MILLLHLMLTHNEITLFGAGSCYWFPFEFIELLFHRYSPIWMCNITNNGVVQIWLNVCMSFSGLTVLDRSSFFPIIASISYYLNYYNFALCLERVSLPTFLLRRNIPLHFPVHFMFANFHTYKKSFLRFWLKLH